MKHKQLVFGVSLALGALVFVLLLVVSLVFSRFPVWVALLFGLLVFAAGLVVSGRAYWQGSTVLASASKRLRNEEILYADIASLMENNHERTGALVVTTRRLYFETPYNLSRKRWLLDFALTDIQRARNGKELFRLTVGGMEYKFKVFQCDELVRTVRGLVRQEVRAAMEADEALLAAERQVIFGGGQVGSEGTGQPALPADFATPAPPAATPLLPSQVSPIYTPSVPSAARAAKAAEPLLVETAPAPGIEDKLSPPRAAFPDTYLHRAPIPGLSRPRSAMGLPASALSAAARQLAIDQQRAAARRYVAEKRRLARQGPPPQQAAPPPPPA